MCSRIYKRKWIAVIFIMLLVTSGCSENSEDNVDLVQTPLSEHYLDMIAQGFGGGLSFGVSPVENDWNWEVDGPWIGQLALNAPDDSLQIHVANIDANDRDFLLKVFLNYESVPFRVLGEEAYDKSFTVSVKGGYGVYVPFVLESEIAQENRYKLTAVLFINPQERALDQGELLGRFAVGENADLFLGQGVDSIKLDVPFFEPLARRENDSFTSIAINEDFDVAYFKTRIGSGYELDQIRSTPGEIIDLSLFVNPCTGTFDDGSRVGYEIENYIILGLLEHQQIELSDKPFLFVDMSNHSYQTPVDHLAFTLQVPDEPGYYEFVAILVVNPTKRNSNYNFFSLELSRRLTIIVE